jgi:uncharacterized protein (TIGR02996 family)
VQDAEWTGQALLEDTNPIKELICVRNERRALLAGVCALPDEDAPRLVFADWLEEHGSDGDLAWAEFIRAQIELERLDHWSERHATLRARASELRDQLPEDFEAGFPPWAELKHPEPSRGWCPPQGMDCLSFYRRGFRHCAWASPTDFVARSHELFAAFPVQCVVFARVFESGLLFRDCPSLARLRDARFDLFAHDFALRDFVNCPSLAGLKVLGLEFFEPDVDPLDSRIVALLGDEEAAILAACPHLRGVKSLYLRNNRIGPAGLGALVRSPHWGPMERLGINGNPTGDDGVARLSRSPWLRHLVFLDLEWTHLGDDGLRSLARGSPSRLKTLKVGGQTNRFSAAGIRSLGKCEALTGLRELSFNWTPLDRRAVRALATAPSFADLCLLDLHNTGLDDEMAGEFSRSPHLHNLRHLNLQNNPIGPHGAAALAGSAVLTSVEELGIYGTRIGDEGVAALASSEHLGMLRYLHVSGTGAGPTAARAIAMSRRLPQVRFLSLEGLPIGDEGGKALCESPNLDQLRSLTVRDCGISEGIIAALRERFGEALRV